LSKIIVETSELYHEANDPHKIVIDDNLEVIQDAVPDVNNNIEHFIEKVKA